MKYIRFNPKEQKITKCNFHSKELELLIQMCGLEHGNWEMFKIDKEYVFVFEDTYSFEEFKTFLNERIKYINTQFQV